MATKAWIMVGVTVQADTTNAWVVLCFGQHEEILSLEEARRLGARLFRAADEGEALRSPQSLENGSPISVEEKAE